MSRNHIFENINSINLIVFFILLVLAKDSEAKVADQEVL